MRVLHLEDSALDAELIQARMAEGGLVCEIRRVDSREGFQRALAEGRYDLLLADYSLPSFDGVSALEIARTECPETPFLFVSGAIGEVRAIESLKRGATDYVFKHQLERLVPAVQRALREIEERLDRRRAEEALRILAEAGKVLGASLDLQDTIDRVSRIMVPALADGCAVELLTEDGTVDRYASASTDGERELLLRLYGSPVRPEPPGAAETVRTGGADLALPLIARGKTLGSVTLVRFAPGSRFGEHDVKLAEELARRAAVAIDNARLYREVQIAAQAKDVFLSTLAHELRNPLGPIVNALHLLRMRGSDPPTRERVQSLMDRQVQHLVRLIDDLLAVSRITRGKISLQEESIDLTTVVTNAVEDQRGTLEGAGLKLRLEVPEGPIRMIGDPTRLSQALGNLLQNAAKFTNAGGEVTVRLSRDAAGETAILRVADTGIGMEPEMLARAFEPFTQADRSLDRSRGGLGLGLPLVRGLIDLHGGQVEARSEGEGKGSEFVIRLPLSPKPVVGNEGLDLPTTGFNG